VRNNFYNEWEAGSYPSFGFFEAGTVSDRGVAYRAETPVVYMPPSLTIGPAEVKTPFPRVL